jgi:DNA-binding response OmpR family regulator
MINKAMEEEKCILVCDDDKSTIELLRAILEKEGYSVQSVTTSDKIFFKIDKCKPGLILMDVWMPEIGGELSTHLLKHHKETQDIPILILSGDSEIENIARDSGADGFIKKPFTSKELIAVIESYYRQAGRVAH